MVLNHPQTPDTCSQIFTSKGFFLSSGLKYVKPNKIRNLRQILQIWLYIWGEICKEGLGWGENHLSRLIWEGEKGWVFGQATKCLLDAYIVLKGWVYISALYSILAFLLKETMEGIGIGESVCILVSDIKSQMEVLLLTSAGQINNCGFRGRITTWKISLCMSLSSQ